MPTLTTTALEPEPTQHADSTTAAQRRDEDTHRLLMEAAETTGAERRRLLDEVVLINLGIADALAHRYGGRGQEHDDLVQVASVGLVKAVQRYDVDAGSEFLAYAIPTITGEIKRHFRDHAWAVRPPRRIQNLQAVIPVATAELSQKLHRSPTPAEVAEHAGEDLGDVIEAMSSRGCYAPTSLDTPGHDDDSATLADLLGTTDDGFAHAEAVALLGPACRGLCERDQRILYLRFFRGWTQREIADDLGVTQMQVSRLLSAIVRRLRLALGITVTDGHRSRRTRRDPGPLGAAA